MTSIGKEEDRAAALPERRKEKRRRQLASAGCERPISRGGGLLRSALLCFPARVPASHTDKQTDIQTASISSGAKCKNEGEEKEKKGRKKGCPK